MFKFMKSKKGFTLVELMIVVVIMAILVAVAVPIYNAVTENARKKTCAANRRNIISQITNNVMSNPAVLGTAFTANGEAQTITITTNDKGDDVVSTFDVAETIFVGGEATFLGWFNTKNRPICPVANGKLVVTMKPGAKDVSSLDVTVDCAAVADGGADHDAVA